MHVEREVLTGANATTVVRRSIDRETGGGGMDPIANITNYEVLIPVRRK